MANERVQRFDNQLVPTSDGADRKTPSADAARKKMLQRQAEAFKAPNAPARTDASEPTPGVVSADAARKKMIERFGRG